jgi:serine/threonine protein kinase
VTAPIGEGGMGQVYRVRDTKPDREVANKILPKAFAHDADRLADVRRSRIAGASDGRCRRWR